MPNITNFDITVSAVTYAQIAGTLAGFVFVILVWLIERFIQLENYPETGASYKQALVFLVVTFLANIVVAILWALVSGETEKDVNRPTVLSFFATLNFALAAPLTIETIVFVIASTRIQEVIPIFRRVFGVSVIISLFYVWVTTTDLLVIQMRSKVQDVFQENLWFFSGIFLLTIAPLLAGWFINKQAKDTIFKLNRETNFDLFVSVWLFGILSSAVAFGTIAVLEPNRYLPFTLILGMDFLWALLMGWAIIFLPSTRHSQTSSAYTRDISQVTESLQATTSAAVSTDKEMLNFLLGYVYRNEKDEEM